MTRIDAIYARQSIEKKDSISIEAQIELCRHSADSNAAVYQDAGYSGKNTQRPAFTQLMADVRAGKIKRVFCYRLDRISRSVLDFSLLWETFDEMETEFVSVSEAFDTNTPMGRAMVIIIMTFAQLERETIVSRYTANRYARSNSGIWAGGKAPYGFTIIKKSIHGKKQSVLSPVPDELKHVEWMFAKYASGTVSLHSLAKELNLNGVSTNGKSNYWNATRIRRILKNPVYARADVDLYSYYYQDAEIANDIHDFDGSHAAYLTVRGGKTSGGAAVLSLAYHKGIIPSSVFVSVQKSLSQNKQIKNGVCSRATWLSGLMKCAKCGGRISTFMNGGRAYLQCYNRFHNVGSCDAVIHGNTSSYEAYVEKAIVSHVFASPQNSQSADQHDEQLNTLKIKLLENEKQTSNLIEAIKIGGASTIRLIQSELRALENEHDNIIAEINKYTPRQQLPEGFMFVDFNALDTSAKRSLARTLINQIFIGSDQPQSISWKF